MIVPRKTTRVVDSLGFTLLAVHSTGMERGPVWVRIGSSVNMSSSTFNSKRYGGGRVYLACLRDPQFSRRSCFGGELCSRPHHPPTSPARREWRGWDISRRGFAAYLRHEGDVDGARHAGGQPPRLRVCYLGLQGQGEQGWDGYRRTVVLPECLHDSAIDQASCTFKAKQGGFSVTLTGQARVFAIHGERDAPGPPSGGSATACPPAFIRHRWHQSFSPRRIG